MIIINIHTFFVKIMELLRCLHCNKLILQNFEINGTIITRDCNPNLLQTYERKNPNYRKSYLNKKKICFTSVLSPVSSILILLPSLPESTLAFTSPSISGDTQSRNCSYSCRSLDRWIYIYTLRFPKRWKESCVTS